MNPQSKKLSVELKHQDAEDGKISAMLISKALAGSQKIVNMIANEVEDCNDTDRESLSSDRASKYSLYVEELQVGSAIFTFSLGDSMADSLALDDIDNVFNSFIGILRSVVEKRYDSFIELIKNRPRRLKIMEAFKSMIPAKESKVGLSIKADNKAWAIHTEQVVQHIAAFIYKEACQEHDAVFAIGKLTDINFKNNEFKLEYKLTGKKIQAKYPPESEEFLLRHPRENVQICCKAKLNQDLVISKILEIYSINSVDLTPIILDSFSYDGDEFRLAKPIELEVKLDDEYEQLFCVDHPFLNLKVAAYTREELMEDIHEELSFSWDFYVEELKEPMRPEVREFRENLKSFMEKVNG